MLFKQADRCAMGSLLSVILSDMWIVKMEKNMVIPHKPIFLTGKLMI